MREQENCDAREARESQASDPCLGQTQAQLESMGGEGGTHDLNCAAETHRATLGHLSGTQTIQRQLSESFQVPRLALLWLPLMASFKRATSIDSVVQKQLS